MPTETKREPRKARRPVSRASSGLDYIAARTERESADARYRDARARLAELRAAVAAGEYHEVAECERRILAHIAVVRRRLLNLGREIAPHLVGLDVRQIASFIDKKVREILTEFASERI